MSEPANPFAPRPRGRYEDVIPRVKAWTRAAMELEENEPVSVTELACTIPGCPPRETVIVAMPNKGHWLKATVHKAMGDVLEEDILWALRYAERVERTPTR
jgi:hypothetical protein